jgi:pyruvate-ferredoxin/flavodoxin oxidoreductase
MILDPLALGSKTAKTPSSFQLDSSRPHIPLLDYRSNEGRYQQLQRANPTEAERLLGMANEALWLRWNTYEELATRSAADFHPVYE